MSNIFTVHLNFFQFDYLKSLEIEEKINKIRWCQTANGAVFLLSTNDKTIKFWKVANYFYFMFLHFLAWQVHKLTNFVTFQVQEKKVKKIADMNMDSFKSVGNGSIATSSVTSSNKLSHTANGEYTDKSYCSLNKDFSSLGAIQSLRLPVVVVLN